MVQRITSQWNVVLLGLMGGLSEQKVTEISSSGAGNYGNIPNLSIDLGVTKITI